LTLFFFFWLCFRQLAAFASYSSKQQGEQAFVFAPLFSLCCLRLAVLKVLCIISIEESGLPSLETLHAKADDRNSILMAIDQLSQKQQ